MGPTTLYNSVGHNEGNGMDWYYAESGQQRGPVDESGFADLVRNGKVRDDTLVWREGMAQWQPFGVVRARVPTGDVPQALPGEVSRPSAGSSPALGRGGWVTREQLIERDYDVDVGSLLSVTWAMFTANAGLLIGATALVFLALLAMNFVPYLGFILSLILTGPLLGGLWCFYLWHIRNREVTVGDAFSGFGPRFGQLALTNIVTSILVGLCMVPAFGLLIVTMLIVGFQSGGSTDFAVGSIAWMMVVGLLLIGAAGSIYLSVSWFFAIPLVADKGLDFWPAMMVSWRVVKRHWWLTLWLALVAGLLSLLGMLVCGVGLLVTGPVAMGLVSHHYQKVFGDLIPES
jgi:hypothetical protein